ncbi:MAG: hypothetical protein ABI175_17225, partial [Polyangiales bacterium]
MIPAHIHEALATISSALSMLPDADVELRAYWRDGVHGDLPRDVRKAADEVEVALAPLTREDDGADAVAALLDTALGEVVA